MKSQNRYTARRLSEYDIARQAIYYRDAFGVSDELHLNIIEVLEFEVKKFLPDFKLMIRRDIELDTTAATTFDPPRIIVRETVYDAACDGDSDSRRILAHELGHLLLHSKLGGSMQRDYNGYEPQFKRLSSLESTEAQADAFARHFLAPPHIAYSFRSNVVGLARQAKIPLPTASEAIKVAKRTELLSLREKRSYTRLNP